MTTAYWKDFWGSSWRRTNRYGNPSPSWDRDLYAKGYHRGEDIANRGSVANVPALRSGEVIDSGRSSVIGYWVCIKPTDAPNRRDIYCHMYQPTAKKSGKVKAGDIIGRTAGAKENPGNGWSGPHLHFVISTGSHGGFNVKMADYDPRPVIKAALAAANKPTPTKPAPTPAPAPAGSSSKTRRTISGSSGTVNARLSPTTASKTAKTFKRGTSRNFDAYQKGETVSKINLWFRDADTGAWVWAGNLTSRSTSGLKNLGTYKKPAPKAKKEYVRLSGTWYYYKFLTSALGGKYSASQRLGKGDYLVIKKDSRGPVQVKSPKGNVWLGTRNTKPTIIKK